MIKNKEKTFFFFASTGGTVESYQSITKKTRACCMNSISFQGYECKPYILVVQKATDKKESKQVVCKDFCILLRNNMLLEDRLHQLRDVGLKNLVDNILSKRQIVCFVINNFIVI